GPIALTPSMEHFLRPRFTYQNSPSAALKHTIRSLPDPSHVRSDEADLSRQSQPIPSRPALPAPSPSLPPLSTTYILPASYNMTPAPKTLSAQSPPFAPTALTSSLAFWHASGDLHSTPSGAPETHAEPGLPARAS